MPTQADRIQSTKTTSPSAIFQTYACSEHDLNFRVYEEDNIDEKILQSDINGCEVYSGVVLFVCEKKGRTLFDVLRYYGCWHDVMLSSPHEKIAEQDANGGEAL